jgi:hypothetical protein
MTLNCTVKRRDSTVGTATGYALDGWGSISGRDKEFFCIPQGPDRLWISRSVLSNAYWRLFPQDKVGGA